MAWQGKIPARWRARSRQRDASQSRLWRRVYAALFCLGLTALALASSTIAIGQTQETPRRTIVILASANGPSPTEALVAAIRSQLGDVPVRVEVETVGEIPTEMRARIDLAAAAASRHRAVGAFWIDVDAAGDYLLFLVEPDGSRSLVRRIRRLPSAESAALEEIAVISRASVTALLDGRRIGMEGPAAPLSASASASAPAASSSGPFYPPPPAITRAAEPSVRAALWLGVGYLGSSYSSRVPWQQGMILSARYSPLRTWHLGFAYGFLPAAEIDTDQVSVRLGRHPFELNFGHGVWAGPLQAGLELAAILDQTDRYTVAAASSRLVPQPDQSTWSFGLSPRARLAWRVSQQALLFTSVGSDVFFRRVEYVIESSTNEIVTSPRAIRARFEAGLAVDAW